MRIAFDIDDDLRRYAVEVMRRGVPLASASRLAEVGGAQVAVLERCGVMQVELCCLRGGTEVPEHVHTDADTIEIGIAGAIRLFVIGVDPFARVPDAQMHVRSRGRGIRINAGVPHRGVVLPQGVWFLSVQRWKDEPRSVLTDYVGAPLCAQHAEMLA